LTKNTQIINWNYQNSYLFILGFLEPQDGVIRFNGQKIDTTSSRVLRSMVAYLPQNSFLINESLKKNIAFKKNNEK
jgi:ABC-type bacteriocin/lantibiotic exporter with double-glycine peptidase domain